MCRFSLWPKVDDLPPIRPGTASYTLEAFSAYDLPSIEALVHYFHASAGFPVKFTWLSAIKEGNYSTCTGLRYYTNAAKYWPYAKKTIKGHRNQTGQCVRSTDPKSNTKPETTVSLISSSISYYPSYFINNLSFPTGIKPPPTDIGPLNSVRTDEIYLNSAS